jgi:uncharacterized UBP type Zn finger protein
MAKKCVYCNVQIEDERSLDVCDRCGLKVWGEKMFKTIMQNMDSARDRGDLCSTNTQPNL